MPNLKPSKNLEEKAEEEAEKSGELHEDVRDALEKTAKQRPYRVDYFDNEYGPFFKPKWEGTQIVVYINRQHPFYDTLYGSLLHLNGGGQAKQAVDLLLITLARAELTVTDEEMKYWYETQREQVWSRFLSDAMKSLKRRMQATDEEAIEAEFVQTVLM